MGILCCKAKSEDLVVSMLPDSESTKVNPLKFNNKVMPAINVVQPTPEVLRRESLELAKKHSDMPAEIPDKIIQGRIPGTFPIVKVPVAVPHSVVTPKLSLDEEKNVNDAISDTKTVEVNDVIAGTKAVEADANKKNEKTDMDASDADNNIAKQKDISDNNVHQTVDGIKNETVYHIVATNEILVEEVTTKVSEIIKSKIPENLPEIITEAALIHSTEVVAKEVEVTIQDVTEEVDVEVKAAGLEDIDTLLPAVSMDKIDPTLSTTSDWSWPSVTEEKKPSSPPASSAIFGLQLPMSPSRKFSQLEPMALDSPSAKHVNDKFVVIPHEGK